MAKNIVGWSPLSFKYNSEDDTWITNYDAIVGNFYMIKQQLFQVVEVVSRQEEVLTGEYNNIIEQSAFTRVKLRRVGTADTVDLIEKQLLYFFNK